MIWILAAVCALLLLIYIRSEYEKKHFSVETYEIQSEKIKDGERTFVFLSDLHDNRFGPGQKDLLEAIEKIKPDGVMIGGDMMITDRSKDFVDTERALYLARQLAGRYPVYYGFGNHESRMEWAKGQFGNVYQEYCEQLRRAGVHIVKGRERYEIGSDIAVAGLEIPKECYRKFAPESLDIRLLAMQLGEADKDRYQILLAHTPTMFKQYRAWGADLTLAGHFHGGTIRIPLLGGLMTPQFQFFYRYCGGKFVVDGHTMIVSRGLGTHSVNIRLNNRAQLVVVKLKGERNPKSRGIYRGSSF